MKKLFCMILTLIMVMSLCACGQEKPNTKEEANNQTNQTVENNNTVENNTDGTEALGEPSEEIQKMMNKYDVFATKLKNYANGEEIFCYISDEEELVGREALTYIYEQLSDMEELDAWYGTEWMPKDDPNVEWDRQKLLAGFTVQEDALLKLSCVITTQTEDIEKFENAYVWEYNSDGTIARISFVDMLYTKLTPFWLDVPHIIYNTNKSGKDYFRSMCSLTFTYDENGNMLKIKRHATSTDSTRDLINLEWDASGKLVSANSVDGDGAKQDYTFTYDDQGQMISADRITKWDTLTQNYTYNEKGQLLLVEQGKISYKYTYDVDGRLVKVEYDDRVSWANSNLGKVEVTFTYDDQGRPATATYSEGYFSLKYGQTLDFSKVEFQYVYGDYCTYAPAN